MFPYPWLVKVLVAQVCPTLRDPMDSSTPGSSVHGILQVRVPEWVAIPSPEDLSDPEIEPGSPTLQADSLPSESPGKTLRRLSPEELMFLHCGAGENS